MMWFPEMFNRFDEWSRTHDNAEADICEVTAYVTQLGTHSAAASCDAHIHSDVFMESLITVAAAIPSNIFAVLGMDRLGRKFFLGMYQLLTNQISEAPQGDRAIYFY